MSTPPFEPGRNEHPGAASATEHDALPAGTRFGELEILRVLGVGGFGIVYLAFDHSLEREVALKEYMPASLAARGAGPVITVRSGSHAETYAIGLRSFVNEARLLARFDHPSLVKVYRFWEDNATAYMVMPYLQGRTLRDARRAMPQAPDEAWLRGVIDPVMHALELLHREGVYHRDIAPDNILLPPEGVPVLLDFGAARRVISDRTQSLTAILKPSYAPIEQYADMTALRQGPWTDVYALGAVVHYLLQGVPPPPATTRAIQDDMVPLEQRAYPGVSPRFLAAIDWALALRPTDRPQSVDALRAALDGLTTPPRFQRHDITLPAGTAAMPAAPANAFEPTLRVDASKARTDLEATRQLASAPAATTHAEAATVVLTPTARTAAFTAAAAATAPSVVAATTPAPKAAPAPPPTPTAAPKRAAPPVAVATAATPGKRGLVTTAWILGLVLLALAGGAGVRHLVAARAGTDAAASAVAADPGLAVPAPDVASAAAATTPTDPSPAVAEAPPQAAAPVAEVPIVTQPGTDPPTADKSPAERPTVEKPAVQAPAPVAAARAKPTPPASAAVPVARSREPAVPAERPPETPVVEARPRVPPVERAPAPVVATGPATAREACGSRVLFALWSCIERECQNPRYSQQAECVKVMEEKRARDFR